LSAYLVRDESSPRLQGQPVQGLPSSMLELVGGTGGSLGVGAFEERASRLARVADDGVIIGEASARLVVVE
jgi:hypothetical protein